MGVGRTLSLSLFLSLLLSSLLSSWSGGALAATVVIVRPASSTPALAETLSRLHGELLSVGLEATIVERRDDLGGGPGGGRPWLERVASERGIDAALDIVGDAAPIAVDVWVFQRTPRRAEVTRVVPESDAENPAERLAIRAVEVLRSSFLEGRLDGPRKPVVAAAAENPASPAATARGGGEPAGATAEGRRAGFGVGVAAVASLDGVGPAFMPILRADWTLGAWLALQGELAGFGSRPRVATTEGSARVAQQYAVLGVCNRASTTGRVHPHLALAVGALHTAVDGEATAPNQGHAVARWSFLLEASVGARVRLNDAYDLTLALHAQVAEPYVAIHIVDSVVATSGRPNLLLTLTVGRWL